MTTILLKHVVEKEREKERTEKGGEMHRLDPIPVVLDGNVKICFLD